MQWASNEDEKQGWIVVAYLSFEICDEQGGAARIGARNGDCKWQWPVERSTICHTLANNLPLATTSAPLDTRVDRMLTSAGVLEVSLLTLCSHHTSLVRQLETNISCGTGTPESPRPSCPQLL